MHASLSIGPKILVKLNTTPRSFSKYFKWGKAMWRGGDRQGAELWRY